MKKTKNKPKKREINIGSLNKINEEFASICFQYIQGIGRLELEKRCNDSDSMEWLKYSAALFAGVSSSLSVSLGLEPCIIVTYQGNRVSFECKKIVTT